MRVTVRFGERLISVRRRAKLGRSIFLLMITSGVASSEVPPHHAAERCPLLQSL